MNKSIYDTINETIEHILLHNGIPEIGNRYKNSETPRLYNLRNGARKKRNSLTALQLAGEIVARECVAAKKDNSIRRHRSAVYAMVSVFQNIAYFRNLNIRTARAMSVDIVSGFDKNPNWLQSFINKPNEPLDNSSIYKFTGLSISKWNAFIVDLISATSDFYSNQAYVSQRNTSEKPLEAAEMLAQLRKNQSENLVSNLEYDNSDRNIKLRKVIVDGFRGSPGQISIDMTKRGKPYSILLWGDNGHGKSTLIDGIEFSLQHRVDRSSDFNSTLRSRVKNLNRTTASASVELTDDSIIERSLETNTAGREQPSHLDVRPGFRIAPIVIRRSDIIRFLDTDSKDRGTIFFDYFPSPDGPLGTRPDEELQQLEEEQYVLMIQRKHLADALGSKYPNTNLDFLKSDDFQNFLFRFVPGSVAHRRTADIRQYVPEFDIEQIYTLQETHKRLKEIKRKLQTGINTFNPVAYNSQHERISPILSSAGAEITDSFKSITHAEHIRSIQVLVAQSGPVSLDLIVEFDNGQKSLPQQAFSEGYKDLTALLFFLIMAKKSAEHGQAKVLIIDDALQSVDTGIRVGLMNFVLEQFHDWQIIITGNDRAWHAQLRSLFATKGHQVLDKTVRNWRFMSGPVISGEFVSRNTSLRHALDSFDERSIENGVGTVLEELCQNLSFSLNTSVQRKPGDKYTIGDLWPSIKKTLRKTSLKENFEAIDSVKEIRNITGAHFNFYSDEISIDEIVYFGERVLDLFDSCYCHKCMGWIRKDGIEFSCPCRNIVIKSQ